MATKTGANFPYKPVAHLVGSNGPVHALTYSATPGTYILTGSTDRSIRLYNPSTTFPSTTNVPPSSFITTASSSRPPPPLPTPKTIATYTSHTHPTLSLSVSSNNSHFASSDASRSILLWDVAASFSTSSPVRRFSCPGGTNSVVFAGEDDSLLISGGSDAILRIWDLRSNSSTKPIMSLSEAKDAIQQVAARGAEIMSVSADGRVRGYEVRTGKVVTDVVGGTPTGVGIARDGEMMLVSGLGNAHGAGADGNRKGGSDAGTGSKTARTGGNGGGKRSAQEAATAGVGGLKLFDRKTGKCLRSYLAPGRKNTEFRLGAILGGKEQFVLAGDEMDWGNSTTGSTTNISSSSSIAAGAVGADAKLWIWDLLSGTPITTLRVPWGPSINDGRREWDRDRRSNVLSCIAWKEGGFGDTFAVGGTSGVVTVFGRE